MGSRQMVHSISCLCCFSEEAGVDVLREKFWLIHHESLAFPGFGAAAAAVGCGEIGVVGRHLRAELGAGGRVRELIVSWVGPRGGDR